MDHRPDGQHAHLRRPHRTPAGGDAAFQASIEASDGFLKTPEGKDFAFAGPSIDDPKFFGLGDGLGMRKQDVELRDAFNKALVAILANGTYARINKKYFDFDIYGAK